MHSIYSDSEGRALYKVQTPFTLAKGRRWDISRVRDAATDSIHQLNSPYTSSSSAYESLAQIHWRKDTVTLFFGEQRITADDFFQRGGVYGRNRTFTGPDGQGYKWILGTIHPQLVRNDEHQTPVAKFHREHHRMPFIKHRLAFLDIYPPGEDIVDFVFITFLYIQKVRQDQLGVLRGRSDDDLE